MCRSMRLRACVAVVLAGCSAWTGGATAGDRTAERILKEHDALKYPTPPRGKPAGSPEMKEYLARRAEVWAKGDALILELYRSDPGHPRIPRLMSERWSRMGLPADFGAFYRDVDEVLARDPNPALRVEGLFVKARVRLHQTRSGESLDLGGVDEFIELAPGDPRGAGLLGIAIHLTRDDRRKSALEERLVKDFPDSPEARRIEGGRMQREMVGKPFDLEFADAMTGAAVSMKRLRGQVIVIDFWATWCAPCVAEMPRLKELYARYHDRGVEFIGVSLDEPREKGGLDKLKRFVEENRIPWPQYYQGNGWQSEFSSRVGIHAIPRVFVVDREGKLHSVEARGQLDRMIPELLGRGEEGKVAPASEGR